VKEDVLEQVVDDFLKFNGYLTAHNVRFKPDPHRRDYDSQQDSVHSDIDVIGYNPRRNGLDRVVAVNCKSWQGGFNADRLMAQLHGRRKNPKRETWRNFRELWKAKWSHAFIDSVEELTGRRKFVYRIAVTRLDGNPDPWSEDKTFKRNLPGCSIGFLTLEEMWKQLLEELTETPTASEIGRLAQLLKAAGLTAGSEDLVAPS
jgi:hypothetical protein